MPEIDALDYVKTNERRWRRGGKKRGGMDDKCGCLNGIPGRHEGRTNYKERFFVNSDRSKLLG